MKCNVNGALSSVSKLLTASALSMVLVACGGGTTDTQGLLTDGGDTDGETDGLGLDEGDTEAGFTDDGTVNGLADADQDGIPDINEEDFCKGRGGSDPGSNNAEWLDNCYIEYTINNTQDVPDQGPFNNSTYAIGIQHVLYCRELAGANTQESWSDGLYWGQTRDAVVEFQKAEDLAQDGIVGEETWNRMQELVDTVDTFINTDGNYDAYGVTAVVDSELESGIDCTQVVQFYERFDENDIADGWELASPPGTTGKGSFSIATP